MPCGLRLGDCVPIWATMKVFRAGFLQAGIGFGPAPTGLRSESGLDRKNPVQYSIGLETWDHSLREHTTLVGWDLVEHRYFDQSSRNRQDFGFRPEIRLESETEKSYQRPK